MWPKLASVINAMIDQDDDNKEDEKESPRIDEYDLSDEFIDNVINILKEQRHLPVEEREYLRKLICRAHHRVLEHV